MQTIDRALTKEILSKKGVKKRKYACWYNATKSLMSIPELSAGVYVEGFVVVPDGRVVEHGWMEINGRVIDTTPSYYEEKHKSVINRYFAGKRYSVTDVFSMVGKQLPLADIFNDDEYMGALQAANKYNQHAIQYQTNHA